MYVGDHAVLQLNYADISIPGCRHGPRKHLFHPRLKHPNLSVRLSEIGAWTKPSDHGHEVARPIGHLVSWIVVQWDPQLCFRGGETEGCRHHADYLTAHAFEFNRAAYNRRVFS